MRKIYFFIFCCIACCESSAQYIPMPWEHASWRYRIHDIDGPLTFIIDQIIEFNGLDTVANGHTYHQLISRVHESEGEAFFNPPLTDFIANHPDIYYAAIREESKKVYALSGSTEKLLFDFNAGVGDAIPAYTGTVVITSIDSILLTDGFYHKRFLTADSGYYTVEGAGSSRGLFPEYDDGGPSVVFNCFTHDSLRFSPDTTIPCTYVYPIGHDPSAVPIEIAAQNEVRVYPNPVESILHLQVSEQLYWTVSVSDIFGRIVWNKQLRGKESIDVSAWTKGLYFLSFFNTPSAHCITKRFIVD